MHGLKIVASLVTCPHRMMVIVRRPRIDPESTQPAGMVLRRQSRLWGPRDVCDGLAVRGLFVVAIAEHVSGEGGPD